MAHIQHVLFDFDGTIMDTSEGIFNSFDYALDALGLARRGHEFYRTLIGSPLLDSFKNAFGLDERNARLGMAKYREFYTPTGVYQVSVYPGIEALLQSLGGLGCALYVASSKPERYITELLGKHGLAPHFAFVGGSDMAETRVKKEDIIRYVLEQNGIAHRTGACVMVGDRHYDMTGAATVGVPAVGVTWGFGSRAELEQSGAAAVVDTPAELAQVIARF